MDMKLNNIIYAWELAVKCYLEVMNWCFEIMKVKKEKEAYHNPPTALGSIKGRFSLEGDMSSTSEEIQEYNTVCISRHVY